MVGSLRSYMKVKVCKSFFWGSLVLLLLVIGLLLMLVFFKLFFILLLLFLVDVGDCWVEWRLFLLNDN